MSWIITETFICGSCGKTGKRRYSQYDIITETAVKALAFPFKWRFTSEKDDKNACRSCGKMACWRCLKFNGICNNCWGNALAEEKKFQSLMFIARVFFTFLVLAGLGLFLTTQEEEGLVLVAVFITLVWWFPSILKKTF